MSTDPLRGRTLGPLMGRPFCTTPSQYCCSLHNPKLTSWSQPLSDYGGKREMNRGAPLVSSRWNPTPEQVQALEEMYRRGTRTPSAEQIQQIAAKLRRFGKIEGKNVFYWFQNHKARDRQKKRRQLELLAGKDISRNGRKQSGLSRKYMEIEHPKKLTTMSKCNTSSKYLGGEVEECKRDGWTQLELQQQISVTAKNLSSCMSPNVSMHKIAGQENAHPFVALNLGKMLTPKEDDLVEFESRIEENRTLQLFPVRSSGLSTLCSTKEDMNIDVSSAGAKLVPNQFFEFLPTKN